MPVRAATLKKLSAEPCQEASNDLSIKGPGVEEVRKRSADTAKPSAKSLKQLLPVFLGAVKDRPALSKRNPTTGCSTSKVPLVTRSQRRPFAWVAEGLVELKHVSTCAGRGKREAVTGLTGEGLS